MDISKREDATPNCSSRLQARDIRKKGDDPISAPTSPLESFRTVPSLAATNLKGEKVHDRDARRPFMTQISFVDIARAYFCASTDPDDPTHVELLDGDGGRGCRVECSGALSDLGFTAGMASACVFRQPSRGLARSVPGGDLSTEGPKDQLDWFVGGLRKKYGLKEGAPSGASQE